MFSPLALCVTAFFHQSQNPFNEHLSIVRAFVRPSGSPDETSDVPMRGVPILHRGDRIGISFPTLAHTNWQASVAFYYQGDPLRWQNQYNSADWTNLRTGENSVSLHLAQKSGESPLLILAHECDSFADRKSLIGALRSGFPKLVSSGAQLQSTLHQMTDLERLMNALAGTAFTPGQTPLDELNLVAAGSDYQLTAQDKSTNPLYWVQFMNALNQLRASGGPPDFNALGAALGGSLPPLARTVAAAGMSIYNLVRTPERVTTYNIQWLPLYEDGDQYRCAIPPIAEHEPQKTVLIAWLPVANSTELPPLSLESSQYRYGDAAVSLHLSPSCAPLLVKPEARAFRLKVGPDETEYPLKASGANLVLDAASAHAIAQECGGKPVTAKLEMQYGLDPVDSPSITFEPAQSYSWKCDDPKSLEQLEAGAPSATIFLNPVAKPGAAAPRITKCELVCGGEKATGTPEVQPNGSIKVTFAALPKSHGPATVELYEEGLDRPDGFACQVFASRPAISKISVLRGDSTCVVEGTGIDTISHLDIGGAGFVRQSGNSFRTSDGRAVPAAGAATVTLGDGRTVMYPVSVVDPSAQFTVASQVVGPVPTPALVLPRNLVTADTVIEISVEVNRPVLTGTTQYEVRQRLATSGADHGHVPMRAGATAMTALYHGPIRDFLPANSVGKFDLRVVAEGNTSDYIPITVNVEGKPSELEVVDLPQITGFEILPGKWRLYGTGLEFIRSISADGHPLPIVRQMNYLEFDGPVPHDADVRLLDSNAQVGLTFSGLTWKTFPDFGTLGRWFVR